MKKVENVCLHKNLHVLKLRDVSGELAGVQEEKMVYYPNDIYETHIWCQDCKQTFSGTLHLRRQ
jgi:hypothetical protein